MPRIYLIIVLSVVLILTGCVFRPLSKSSSEYVVAPLILPQQPITIGDVSLVVEVAREPAELAQGLSGRVFMAEDTGMLFLFAKAGHYSFWMSRMNFGLDFIWLLDDQVVEIMPNISPPTTANPQPQTVTPSQPVTAVIEVNAGWAARNNIEAGVRVWGLTR